jgi:hypothetical protein
VFAHRAFGNPSYHVQALFAEHQGLAYARTAVDSAAPRDSGVAASAACRDAGCNSLSIKVFPASGNSPVSQESLAWNPHIPSPMLARTWRTELAAAGISSMTWFFSYAMLPCR